MRVAGNAVYLTAYFLELLILVRQILKLCRTDKRKIRRIEKEHAPLSEHILLGHLPELVIYKRLNLEIHDFLID
jgi:hypothetical protein